MTRDSACVIVFRYLCTTLAMLLITKLVRAPRGLNIVWKGIYHMDRSVADFSSTLRSKHRKAVAVKVSRIKICNLFQLNKKF